MGTQNLRRRETSLITLGTGSAKMDIGEHASAFNLSKIWDILQGPDYNDKGPPSLAKLLNGTGGHSNSSDVLFGLQDQLRAQNA